MLLNQFNIQINIDLDNGIYLFDIESATGKTRLCKELRKYMRIRNDVFVYSYDDQIYNKPMVIPTDVKLVMFDRYDMYEGDFVPEILALKSKAILLIDSKRMFSFSQDDEFCYLSMTEDSIEVTL